ncbi:DUF1540 domain-containing protein [Eubacterium multiforme]|uniref:DUF1540 domain-containing protein n=1 Tax=Eubacterium multiforme TaxID=83339 RepID=A0ABT9UY20_9FIRM|nr:DUF1540 domain-containing protein [Eubacterium multiforme]MDQ0151222.1 hypothetical protein [Eubacterium multiforme]
MATLRCQVRECTHNRDSYCCNESIAVGGREAMSSSQTMCNDFQEMSYSIMSMEQKPNPNMEIECNAKNCMYNDKQRCIANYVDISGDNCKEESDTKCATFIERY